MASLARRELASIGIDASTYQRAQKFYADKGISLHRVPRKGWTMSKVCGRGNGACFVAIYRFGLETLETVFDSPSLIVGRFAKEELAIADCRDGAA